MRVQEPMAGRALRRGTAGAFSNEAEQVRVGETLALLCLWEREVIYVVAIEVEVLIEADSEDEASFAALDLLGSEIDVMTGRVIRVFAEANDHRAEWTDEEPG